MRKTHYNDNQEDQDLDINEVEERMKINHPNILWLGDYISHDKSENNSQYQLEVLY